MSFASRFSPPTPGGSFVASILKTKALVCELRYLWPEEGEAWYLFEIDAPKRKEFESRLQQNDSLNLTDYGKVLYSGWEIVPENIKAEMREKYGLYENE